MTEQARLERMKSRSVMVCTPVARNPVWQYTQGLASTMMTLLEHGIPCSFQFVVGGSVICKARNELVAHFLASRFTDLIFIDDDMEWSPNDVLRLLASDKQVIGGVGRMRVEKPNSDPEVWCWRPLTDAAGGLNQDEMGAIEVRGVGAAMLRIHRSVFEAMIAAHPEWKRPGARDWPEEIRANYHEFFAQTAEASEDYLFCNRWRDLGGAVWVDPQITLGHVGSYTYRGSVSEMLVEK
ncbi:hypothetical protein [Ancylobacter polymorphus]|uniref:Glycosyltransferase n=1 Tax=Ancylobacter polymorphus TaxID=223390 RepID=A0ABU0BHK9_9HYPH|nr:hypothetical protein [Ancylobacter polymorphus]MDQ0305328.1 hypothetical protein [Ancylobacter polymorphus]